MGSRLLASFGNSRIESYTLATENILYPLISFIPALFNVGIVIYIVFFLPKGKTTDLFTLFVIALFLWQLEDTVVRICDIETARKWDRILCIGWIALGPLAFHFICRYVSLRVAASRAFVMAVYLPFIFFYLAHISDDHVVFEKLGHWGWIHNPEPASPDGLLRFFISAYVLIALCILFRYAYTIRNNKEKKYQAYMVAIGMLIPALFGITTQVVFPLVLDVNEIPLTSSLLTFFSAGTIIALNKYRLFNVAESVAVETVFENLKKIVLILSPDERVLYANSYTKHLLGIDEKELYAFSLHTVFADKHADDLFSQDVIEKAFEGNSIKNYTTRFQTADKERLDVLLSAEPIINNKVLLGILMVGNDITEHIKTLKALEESNSRFHLISTATNDMVWDWDLITGEVYRNKEGWRKLFHDILDTEMGHEQDWYRKIHPDDLWTIDYMKKQIEEGFPNDMFEMEYKMLKKDGSIAYVIDKGRVIRNEEGKAVRLIGATQDISLRKLSEIRLREEQAQKHKEITAAAIKAQENERNYLGAELHDNVNQILTSAQLYLNLAQNEKHNKDSFLQQAEKILGSAIREIRKLSHTLIPPTLSSQTLGEALDNLVDTTETGGLFCVVRNYKCFDEEAMPDKLKLTIYRIVQEQLNNIIKYSKATSVEIKLVQKQDHIFLSIQDNGVGFDPLLKSNGVGLTNIKTRATLHNGDMKIISSPARGCRLEVYFPIDVKEMVA